MKALPVRLEKKLDELLVVLDKDIQHMQKSMSRLNELRGLVIKRDDASLGKLLGAIQKESGDYRENESNRQSIRKELAMALGCGIEEMTLSKLEAMTPECKRAEVGRRKTELKSLSQTLRKEYLVTAKLLSECARFNNKLLTSILDLGRTGTVTYDSDGSAERPAGATFMSMQL